MSGQVKPVGGFPAPSHARGKLSGSGGTTPSYRLRRWTDTKHERAIRVAEQLLRLGAFSKDPRVKAMSVFSRPAAEVAVSILDEVDRQIKKGVQTAEDIAELIFYGLIGRR